VGAGARFSLVLSAALLFTASAAAAPPTAGVLVPGKSLGSVSLGATPAQVRTAWGSRFGVCRDCRDQTWYFNYRRFEPQGVGVSFRRGRAVALFTIWSPRAWRTSRGLQVGDPAARIAGLYGPLLRVNCGTYAASTLRRGRTTTAIYIVDEQVWGFGLLAAHEAACRR
jgi:hypothetical protein